MLLAVETHFPLEDTIQPEGVYLLPLFVPLLGTSSIVCSFTTKPKTTDSSSTVVPVPPPPVHLPMFPASTLTNQNPCWYCTMVHSCTHYRSSSTSSQLRQQNIKNKNKVLLCYYCCTSPSYHFIFSELQKLLSLRGDVFFFFFLLLPYIHHLFRAPKASLRGRAGARPFRPRTSTAVVRCRQSLANHHAPSQLRHARDRIVVGSPQLLRRRCRVEIPGGSIACSTGA